MSEGHGDPPGDVRSFLPRPGEPVEQYAERLRALHRDLTLVLQAVERGLAAASTPESGESREIRAGDEAVDEAPPAREPVEVVPLEAAEAHASVAPRPPPAAPRDPLARTVPRVEVLPPPSGERRRADVEVEVEGGGEEGAARQPWTEGSPESLAAGPPGAPVAATADPVTRRQRFARRPSDAAADALAEPEWVERAPLGEETFTAATFAPAEPPPARFTASPVVIAALAAGWLTVLALVLALLFG